MSVELNHTIIWCSDKERSAAFLTSDDAGFVTGSTMSMNGGQHMY